MLRPAKKAPAQKAHQENPMNIPHYIGFDVRKKTISFCAAGEIVEEGRVPAQRAGLRQWAEARPQPWRGALEATLFSRWIYDTLKPYNEQFENGDPPKTTNPRQKTTLTLHPLPTPPPLRPHPFP